MLLLLRAERKLNGFEPASIALSALSDLLVLLLRLGAGRATSSFEELSSDEMEIIVVGVVSVDSVSMVDCFAGGVRG